MNRLSTLVFGFLALAILAMAATDTSTGDGHKTWHVYEARTPLTP